MKIEINNHIIEFELHECRYPYKHGLYFNVWNKYGKKTRKHMSLDETEVAILAKAIRSYEKILKNKNKKRR